MATFVDLSPEDEQAQGLITYFLKLEQQQTEAQNVIDVASLHKLLAENKLKEVLTILIEKRGALLLDTPEKDTEGCFNLICSLLRKLEAVSVDELVKKLMKIITSDTNDRPLLRLKILNNLYNMFDNDSISRYEVFMAILSYAKASNNSEVVLPQFKHIDRWLKIWGANVEQTRKLYGLVYKILEGTNKSVLAYRALIKYLSTFDKAEEEALFSAKEDAVKAAVSAVKLPEIHQCEELLEIPAVRQLENDEKYSKLFELLTLFAIDKLESFNTFHDANPDYLQSFGISHEECLKKIRLLSLATLASEHQELPYSLISQTLKIDESEVESWIILAISAKLLQAKLDQLRSVVIITRGTQRVFSSAHWKQLGERLHIWRDNLRSLLQAIQINQKLLQQRLAVKSTA